jgi:hypothetical protein
LVGVDVKSASNARTISHSLARYLEKVGLIQRDIALGPQQGQKVFTLQTLPASTEGEYGQLVVLL